MAETERHLIDRVEDAARAMHDRTVDTFAGHFGPGIYWDDRDDDDAVKAMYRARGRHA
jgi:hypothetical protein